MTRTRRIWRFFFDFKICKKSFVLIKIVREKLKDQKQAAPAGFPGMPAGMPPMGPGGMPDMGNMGAMMEVCLF